MLTDNDLKTFVGRLKAGHGWTATSFSFVSAMSPNTRPDGSVYIHRLDLSRRWVGDRKVKVGEHEWTVSREGVGRPVLAIHFIGSEFGKNGSHEAVGLPTAISLKAAERRWQGGLSAHIERLREILGDPSIGNRLVVGDVAYSVLERLMGWPKVTEEERERSMALLIERNRQDAAAANVRFGAAARARNGPDP